MRKGRKGFVILDLTPFCSVPPGRWQRLGERLSLDHHGQMLLLMPFAIAASLQSGPMALGALLYAIMHFMYGGSGTFQRPPRLGKAETALDILLVGAGILGIGLMLAGLIQGLMGWLG